MKPKPTEPVVTIPRGFDEEMKELERLTSSKTEWTEEELRVMERWAKVYKPKKVGEHGVGLDAFSKWFKKKYGHACRTGIRNECIRRGWMKGNLT